MKEEDNKYNESFLKETLTRVFEDKKYFNIPKGISRFDYGSAHGWWLRISRDGAKFSDFFADKKYDSIEEALKAAIISRHEILSSFPVTTVKFVHSRSLPPEPEKRITLIDRPGRKIRYRAWQARWYDENGKIQRKHFSVHEYGESRAKMMALEAARVNHHNTPKYVLTPDPHLKHKFETLSREDVKILSTINSSSSTKNSDETSVSDDPFAFEGERKIELHLKIERDRTLRQKKINEFLKEHGELFCELCEFNFKKVYPFLTKDIIEIHHIVPLSSLNSSTKIVLSDLMLLCSNCHFAIHQGDAETNLIIALDHFQQNKT